ncbi:MAG TPA: DUF29 domain-containing protein, partial [Rhizobiaceae bacterium]|nr:DUF29 domain-containing protein [Rhizobiaceae bacterium]
RLDVGNLLEEIEDLGSSLRREVESRLETLIEHLVKLSVSRKPEPRAGWRATVREQRRQLARLFRDSPSLRRHAVAVFPVSLAEGCSEARSALADHEPENAQNHEAAIRAFSDLVSIEQVLDDKAFLELKQSASRNA